MNMLRTFMCNLSAEQTVVFVLCLVGNINFLNISVDRVLDRLFSGHFSLNVRTATIGGHLPIQHPNLSHPQPHPMVQSYEGKL